MLKKIVPIVMLGLFCIVPKLQAAAGARGSMRTEINLATSMPKGERMKLILAVPTDEFKPAGHENKGALELFVSRDEQAGKSTHSITKHNGSIASGLVRAITADIKAGAAAPGGRIIEEVEERRDGCTVTTLIATRIQNNRPELIAAHFYAGPTAVGGFQYAVSLDAFTEQEALAKVRAFIANNVTMLRY